MKITILILFLMMLSCTGCADHGVAETSPVPPPQVALAWETPTSLPAETVMPQGVILQSGGLTLAILSPADGVTVTASPLELRLFPNLETVLTVNGELWVLAAQVETALLIDLEEGFNAIELVASDYQGDMIEYVLTVIFDRMEQ